VEREAHDTKGSRGVLRDVITAALAIEAIILRAFRKTFVHSLLVNELDLERERREEVRKRRRGEVEARKERGRGGGGRKEGRTD